MNDTLGEETHEGDPPPLLQPGMVIDRYLIKRMIGRGGMGEVYEAVHQDIKKRVALKTLDPSAARNQEARARFLREGEAAARIQHPHIVNVTDIGTHEQMLYLVMEFLEGEDLDARLRREGALSPEQAADVLIPVFAAVNAAHQVGVVHRDLKPSNIFLAQNNDGDPVPKVLDFGISKLVDPQSNHNLTRSAAVIGTPLYMAPEQAHSSKASDARSDQYSLGVILYQCVTGKLPFDAETYFALLSKIVLGDFAKPRAIRPEIPEELEAAILRAMSREPGDRFDSVQAFGRALLPFAGEEVRVVFRRAFGGGAGETAAYKAVTATPATTPSIKPPPPAAPPLESTLSATSGERRAEGAPSLKRAAPVIAGVALLGLLVVGYSLRSSRATSTAVGSAASITAASPDAGSTASAGPLLAANALAADAGSLTHNGADASALLAAQVQDSGVRAHGSRGRGRDPMQGFFNLFSGPSRRQRSP